MDPEQIYKEVLQEEQSKGSSPPVAEGRAKAARQRAIEGSPHPKEARWWPGSQPQFEGGGAPAEAPAEEAVEEPVEPEAPAATEAPAAEAPAEEPAAEAPAAEAAEPAEAPAEQPAEAPAEQPAAQAPAEQPAAQAAPPEQPPAAEQPAAAVATAEAPAAVPTVGVSPGQASGTRLRPEDAVSTQAQFDGQRAMQERRKLIDDLVATGVPAVTAAQAGRERSPMLSVLLLIVPLLAVLVLVANYGEDEGAPAGGGGGGTSENGGGSSNADATVTAQNVQFDTDTLELPAGQPTTIEFINEDQLQHNIAIYPTEGDLDSQENALFPGELVTGTTIVYELDPIEAGEYPFQCDIHPAMTGTATFE